MPRVFYTAFYANEAVKAYPVRFGIDLYVNENNHLQMYIKLILSETLQKGQE
jgi:hypothetical protein